MLLPVKSPGKQKLNFSYSVLFHVITRVCFKYFVNNCSFSYFLKIASFPFFELSFEMSLLLLWICSHQHAFLLIWNIWNFNLCVDFPCNFFIKPFNHSFVLFFILIVLIGTTTWITLSSLSIKSSQSQSHLGNVSIIEAVVIRNGHLF